MKKKVAFVCVHNSCRSQMAEALLNHLDEGIFQVYSAGTEEYPEVKPLALEVLREEGIDVDYLYPKLIRVIPDEVDYLITMGCNVVCPYIPSEYKEDWGLEDPSGKSIEEFRKTREIIRGKVLDLISRERDGQN